MTVKKFHILLQDGGLIQNVRVLTDTGYANSNAEVYWSLVGNEYIYIESASNSKPIRLDKKDIYQFSASTKY